MYSYWEHEDMLMDHDLDEAADPPFVARFHSRLVEEDDTLDESNWANWESFHYFDFVNGEA